MIEQKTGSEIMEIGLIETNRNGSITIWYTVNGIGKHKQFYGYSENEAINILKRK